LQRDPGLLHIEAALRGGLRALRAPHAFGPTGAHELVARAHATNPSYIACGPIYFTNSKAMSFQPQGIEQLKCWRRTLSYPLVAIGGINLERLPDIVKSKVEGISVISAITQARDPCAAIAEFLHQINQPR